MQAFCCLKKDIFQPIFYAGYLSQFPSLYLNNNLHLCKSMLFCIYIDNKWSLVMNKENYNSHPQKAQQTFCIREAIRDFNKDDFSLYPHANVCPDRLTRPSKETVNKARDDAQGKKTVALMAAFFTFLLPSLTRAEICTATPDCKTLGYTETSCPDGKGVRCPWNTSLMHCDQKCDCSKLGFVYPCTGDGYAGGAGNDCNGQYAICNCAAGYVWNTASKSCEFSGTGLKNGIYYCNNFVAGIQVGNESLVVSLTDFSSDMNQYEALNACSSHTFCGGTKGVLPTKEQLVQIYNNIGTVQNRLFSSGGSQFSESFYWSSTFSRTFSYQDLYYVVVPTNGRVEDVFGEPQDKNHVRCVLAL